MLQELFQNVDEFGATFVAQSYQALAATLTGQAGGVDYLSLLLTLYLIVWGVSIWWGTAKSSVTDQVYRLFRVFVIYTLATSWADFQSLVYDFAQALPSAVGNALLVVVSQNATGDAANLNSTDQVQNALQSLWDSAEATANAFFQTGGITNPGPWFIGAVFLVAMALLVGYAAFLIILAKLFIWLLLGLAPVFIILYLFTQTTSYVEGWLKVIVNFMVVQILTYAALAFFVNIVQTIIDNINQSADDFDVKVGHVMTGVLLCIIGVLLLNQIMSVASNITGGGLGLGAQSIGRFFNPAQRAFSRLTGRGDQNYQDTQNAKGLLTRPQQQHVTRASNYETATKLFRQKLAAR